MQSHFVKGGMCTVHVRYRAGLCLPQSRCRPAASVTLPARLLFTHYNDLADRQLQPEQRVNDQCPDTILNTRRSRSRSFADPCVSGPVAPRRFETRSARARDHSRSASNSQHVRTQPRSASNLQRWVSCRSPARHSSHSSCASRAVQRADQRLLFPTVYRALFPCVQSAVR